MLKTFLMVFSFFKKQPEKMIARPAVAPRPAGAHEKPAESGKTPSGAPDRPATPDDAEQAKPRQELPPLEFSDFVFSESSPDFQIEADIDPVDAVAEEAAVLFANGQDEAVRAVLENAVHTHRSGRGERLWLMLFDLYRLTGQKSAFEALDIEFARSFEKSPPGWGCNKSRAKPMPARAAAGDLVFKGDLLGSNSPAFDAVRQALEKNPRLRLDLSKVAQLDAEGCGQLLSLIRQARKARREVELLGRETLGTLVQGRVETGLAEDRECWLLLLELCQLQGQQEAFEEVAIEYAVTFEESPPSWDQGLVAAPELPPQAGEEEIAGPDSDAYVLRGEVKSSRFGDLPEYAGTHDPVLIDCAALTRMDFISAGALLNSLTSIRNSGKQITFRHPNHLVAELFAVVGLKSVASVVFAKY